MVSEVTAVSQGQDFWVAFEFVMDEHWHIYWRNPGDAGLAPEIEWQLPEGFQIKETLWPYPERIDISPLTNYGYEGKTVLLVKLSAPETPPIDPKISLKTTVHWLACELECVPGQAELSVDLVWKDGDVLLNDAFKQLHDFVIDQVPVEIDQWELKAFQSKNYLQLYLTPTTKNTVDLKGIQFYPYDSNVIDHAAKQILRKEKDSYVLTIQKLDDSHVDALEGVIVSDEGWIKADNHRAFLVKGNVTQRKIVLGGEGPLSGESSISLILLFAFLGGLILNLMPCVLPVLSIKVLNLLEQEREKRSHLILHGVAFTFGILVAFWGLGLLLHILKSTGAQIGWGFQFQEPLFLIGMIFLFLILGLNMIGFFEVGVGLTGVTLKGVNNSTYKGSFLNGILATIVATPCTAPFMGTALGVAFFQEPSVSFAIFSLLGLGLAFPYLMITLIPGAIHLLPKPGRWMVNLKKSFSILFFATAVWLVWILIQQKGAGVIVGINVGAFFVFLGVFIYRVWGALNQPERVRSIAKAATVLMIAAAVITSYVLLDVVKFDLKDSQDKVQKQEIVWQDFSDETLLLSLAQGKAVFLDFTAAWCLTCQVNESVAFTNKDVVEGFKEYDIVTLKADWTNYSPEVTEALARYGRTSIPFYVLYTGRFSDAPIFLPEVLTPKVVLQYFDQHLK